MRQPPPEERLLEARDTLIACGDLTDAADELGMPYATLAYWNRKYGWVTPGGPRVGRTPRPTRWRCDCGRLVIRARRCACGQTPAWAA